MLLFYPAFVFSWRKLLVIDLLKNLMDSIHEAAELHREGIRRYGMIGLFLFVCFPFWMTGPLVGCVIGFLIGLRPWVNLSLVLGGTYLALVGWAFFMQVVQEWLEGMHHYGPLVLVALLIAIVMTVNVIQGARRRGRQKAKKSKGLSDDPK